MVGSKKKRPTRRVNKVEKDRVLFRMIRGEVQAFLPDVPANPGRVMCYARSDGHGEASLGYYREGRPATPAEYMPLKREMVRMGYKPQVIKRLPSRR